MAAGFPDTRRCMDAVLSSMSSAVSVETGVRNYRSFDRAMWMLIGVQHGLVHGDAVDSADLARFRARVVELVEINGVELWTYIGSALDSALRSPSCGWYRPCVRRSAIQFFLDDYPGAADVPSAEDRELLDEMDEVLRAYGPGVEALREEDIPRWAPDRHWWWRGATWRPGPGAAG
jgi:hypothetical protein